MSDERPLPIKSRSTATLDALLRAALQVLVEEGLPGFNTNAVAKVAGVSVATLYQHFPNKVALLRELFERNEAERTNWSISQMGDLATTDDIQGWVNRMSRGFREFRRSEVAGVELRRACRAIPELIDLERERTTMAADFLAEAIRRRLPHLSDERAVQAARLIITVSASVLDAAGAEPVEDADLLIEEAEKMIGSYLGELAAP